MMYNHTCDIAEEMGIDDRWVRTCPPGVRSCFWAEARYDKQGIFVSCNCNSFIFLQLKLTRTKSEVFIH